MSKIARIRFAGGERLMPARSGYDCELVFDEAEYCARRYGEAHLRLGATAMVIRATDCGPECRRCRQPARRVGFAVEDRHLCSRCVRATWQPARGFQREDEGDAERFAAAGGAQP